mgnify:CR=1 FL=1
MIVLYLNSRKRQKEYHKIIKYIEEINKKNYDLKIEENSDKILTIKGEE